MMIAATFCLLAVVAAQPQSQTPPKFVRIVVLDVSSSMAGERLRVAREEILEQIRQLPPSREFPVIVAPFASSAKPPQTFTDATAMKKYLQGLWTLGGTSIASGLESAIKSLAPYRRSKHLCVMLYTDGEDSDKASLAIQEKQLDALFESRDRQGLKQTVVFCKRWGGASASLVAEIAKSGSAKVIDAGSLKLTPVTLSPQLEARGATWSKGAPAELIVEIEASLLIRGNAVLPPVRVRCTNANAQGETAFDLAPGGKPKRIVVRLPESDLQIDSQRKTLVSFDLADSASAAQSGNTLVLPVSPIDHVDVEVTTPLRVLRGQMSATLKPADNARWIAPLQNRVILPMELTVSVVGAQNWDEPVEFRVIPGDDCLITSGSHKFSISDSGTVSHSLAIETTAIVPKVNRGEGVVAVGLVVAPASSSRPVEIQPSAVSVAYKAKAPKKPVTTISSSLRRISPARWTNLGDGTAHVAAEFEVTVAGELSPQTDLVLRCPSAVKAVEIKPSRLRSGKQSVAIQIWARMKPAPQLNALHLHVVPPLSQGAVVVAPVKPWVISVTGPQAPRLALASGDTVIHNIELHTDDSTDAAALIARPVLVDAPYGKTLEELQARILIGSSLTEGNTEVSAQLDEEIRLVLNPKGLRQSFFRDSRMEGEITVLPHASGSIIQGSKQRVAIVSEAPFKRLLFYLSISLGALMAFVLVVRMWVRFRSVDRPRIRTKRRT